MKEEFVLQQESFAKRLIDVLKGRLSNEFVFDYQQVLKANDSSKPAILISNGGHVAKTVYLDEMYNQFCDGREIDSIAESVINICNNHSDIEEINGQELVSHMQDLDYLLDGHCALKLVNREKSQKYLEGKTFLPFLDLAIVFCMTVDTQDKEGIATVAIPRTASDAWEISLEEAYKRVLESIEKYFPLKRTSMYDFMIGLLMERIGNTDGLDLEKIDSDTPMFIQTNREGVNGSVTLLYKDSLAQFCDEKGIKEVYIIPSSQHELILIPNDGYMDGEFLRSMIGEVNDTQVAEDERLSYNLYVYNRDNNEVTIWNS